MNCTYCQFACTNIGSSSWECRKHSGKLITYNFIRPDGFNRKLYSTAIKFKYNDKEFIVIWNNLGPPAFEVQIYKPKLYYYDTVFSLTSHPKNVTLDNLEEKLDMWILLS